MILGSVRASGLAQRLLGQYHRYYDFYKDWTNPGKKNYPDLNQLDLPLVDFMLRRADLFYRQIDSVRSSDESDPTGAFFQTGHALARPLLEDRESMDWRSTGNSVRL